MTSYSRYPYHTLTDRSQYVFSAQCLPAPTLSFYNTLHEVKTLRLSIYQHQLRIPPFYIHQYGQYYINPEELLINLTSLPQGWYAIMAIHNFQVEDCNPNLNECLAGIFLARYIHGAINEPEAYPIECRTIRVLGYVDTRNMQLYDYQLYSH